MVIALSSLGVNPDTDLRFMKNGNSLLDGLLSNLLEDGSMGGDYATKQGFLGLLAAAGLLSGPEQAFSVFDFTDLPKQTAMARSSGSSQSPAPPASDQTIRVSFTLKTHNATWIPKTTVEIAAVSYTHLDVYKRQELFHQS